MSQPTLTVYTAAGGTSIQGEGNSALGHTWYSVNSGVSGAATYSFGFAPDAAHAGQPFAPGQVYTTDTQLYNNGNTSGLYQVVTVPISQADYNTLLSFGQSGVAALGTQSYTAGGVTFDMGYSGVGNSCVDFVWSALSTIGIPWPLHIPGTDLLPTWNAADESSALAAFVADGSQGVGKTVDSYNSSGEVTQTVTYSTTGSVLSTTQYSSSISNGTITSSATVTNSSGATIGSASIIINNTSGAATDNTSSPPTTSTQDLSTTSGSSITDTVTGPASIELSGAKIGVSNTVYGSPATITGTNNVVTVTDEVGYRGVTYAGDVSVNGTGDTISSPKVDVNILNANNSVTVNASDASEILGQNEANLTINIDGTTPVGYQSTASGIGTNSTLNVNVSRDDLTLAANDNVILAADTSGNEVTGSNDTIHEGNSSDAIFDGATNTITLGSGDKVEADGSSDHISSASGDTIDLLANETVTVAGSGDNIVGSTGDTINVTGTSDHIYCDQSTIDINGADSGDIVYGQGDSGDRSDWGGYVDQGGGYGGYGGGGYDGAKKSLINPSTSKSSAAYSNILRTGSANIADIGLADYRIATDHVDPANDVISAGNLIPEISAAARLDNLVANDSDPMSIRAIERTPMPLSARSPQNRVDQLIHAMATWPAQSTSAMFNSAVDTSDAASIQLLAKSSPVSRVFAESHTHAV